MRYGLLGEKLPHSFSKEIHEKLGRYTYELIEVEKENFAAFAEERDFTAINVTIPYKCDIMPYLATISEQAENIGAVNVVLNKGGTLHGYNTDFAGLRNLILRAGFDLDGKTVLILGYGGTSKTAYAVCRDLGADTIKFVKRKADEKVISYADAAREYADADYIINTTPCGMYPKAGVAAVDFNNFPNIEAVFDAVYNPLKSKLILDAEKKGIIADGGLYMLVSQAAYAVEKFIDTTVSLEKIEEVFNKIYKNKMNVVLIGMPASGKSSVGKELEKLLSKSFVDSDIVLSENAGKTISEIFSEYGEAYFRELEKDTIKNISSENSHIIATGGGAILNYENIENLKSNGRIYFLDRPLSMLLTTDDRPLSSNRTDLEKRYNERYELYRKYADVIIDGSGSVKEVAKRIEADFNGYSCN
jgi:shikimate dehydrogenase